MRIDGDSVDDHTHSPATDNHTHPSPISGFTDDDACTMSPQELAVLQTSFNALQEKFVGLMREKADLLDKIQEHEVTILKLSSETETIGMWAIVGQFTKSKGGLYWCHRGCI